MKIIALDAAKGSEKERTAWWHHHPTPRRRLAVLSLSLSLSLSALPMKKKIPSFKLKLQYMMHVTDSAKSD
jgi:hypothetical protein